MSGFSQSRMAAHLQELVARRREEAGLYAGIVEAVQVPSSGRLLEVGCGSGRQLKVVHERAPDVELYGLDLSGAAIRNAKRNLEGLGADLRQGSIERTNYDDGYFDLVTCFSSMSYWNDLVHCFDEIHRILRPGGSARLVEPQEDIDIEEVVETIRSNLAEKSWLRRFLAVNLNRFGLKYGRKIGLRLYSISEMSSIVSKSHFGEGHSIERVSLQGLPIFMLISLMKAGEDQ
jgi:ubiquinone/menaquinone biosynthesis C-methylase UbiE